MQGSSFKELLNFGVDIFKWLSGFRVSFYAANAGYFIILALFPGLILILGLLRYAGMDADSLLIFLEGYFPEVLLPIMQQLIRSSYLHATGTVLSLSALIALWSAGRGIYGLLVGLNAIYEVPETRSYLRIRLVCMGYTAAFCFVLLLTLVLNLIGTSALEELPLDAPVFHFIDDVIGLRFILLLLLQIGLFTAIYMALPNGTVPVNHALPGAILAALGWQGFSRLYSIYVECFSGYAGVYGPVYTVAIGMLWLYFCISIVFYGGVLNRFLMKQRSN